MPPKGIFHVNSPGDSQDIDAKRKEHIKQKPDDYLPEIIGGARVFIRRWTLPQFCADQEASDGTQTSAESNAAKKEPQPFERVSAELKETILSEIISALGILVDMQKEDLKQDEDDRIRQEPQAPSYLISQKAFQEILCQIFETHDVIFVSEIRYITTMQIYKLLEGKKTLQLVSKAETKKKKVYIQYVFGNDESERNERLHDLENTIRDLMPDVKGRFCEFINAHPFDTFTAHTLHLIAKIKIVPKQVFDIIFTRLLKEGILLPPEKYTNYRFADDAAEKLENWENLPAFSDPYIFSVDEKKSSTTNSASPLPCPHS